MGTNTLDEFLIGSKKSLFTQVIVRLSYKNPFKVSCHNTRQVYAHKFNTADD